MFKKIHVYPSSSLRPVTDRWSPLDTPSLITPLFPLPRINHTPKCRVQILNYYLKLYPKEINKDASPQKDAMEVVQLNNDWGLDQQREGTLGPEESMTKDQKVGLGEGDVIQAWLEERGHIGKCSELQLL